MLEKNTMLNTKAAKLLSHMVKHWLRPPGFGDEEPGEVIRLEIVQTAKAVGCQGSSS